MHSVSQQAGLQVPTAITQQLIIRDLGVQDYTSVWHAMQQFTDQRHSDTADELWLLEHHSVFTQGQAGKEEHLLFPGDIPVVKVDRGGQVTYHGPGQLVVYVLLDLKRRDLGVRTLVTLIEQVLVDLLTDYGITAYAKADAPGVYIDGSKIASLGLRVRKGCTFHGLALNVNMDLAPFSRINPCGYAGMQMIQSKDVGGPQSIAEAKQRILQCFQQALKVSSLQHKTGLDWQND
ncbi:MAG: lipoyl(octanoyl) transferase LipB [Gammaproteobacteria bacterium]|nr:lipoyl(octanoyl) transferase LipB [Gammaproteobacteria bacterium]MBU1553664.1 lipoyl(octanoyl) transferase LipB [Gammaproteobacteria bacterium]MBU2071382.1 lipoyl(octanoyl) transferase LipB [Gammaproteobacteria bacterium]MBU2182394.1 lipoyl(octanoyl) transferase LipB [Gammaproteobacteria bacterium]MBU2204132.1 lipoyl(octanoyl) transferase LipB [Gammaproteobacteria bacterium]